MHNNQMKKNSSANKFMSNISTQILTQNHHYKMEIIKMKKVLNNYEQLMVSQFVKLAQDLGISDQEGFVYDQPEQYLAFFIQLVSKYAQNNKGLESEKQRLINEGETLRELNERKNKKICSLELELSNGEERINELEEKRKQQQEKIKKLENKNLQEAEKCQKQIDKHKHLIEKMQSDHNAKLLNEKKQLMQKYSKQITTYRAQMDQGLYQKQKIMKQQIDKRDKQTKSLLSAITSLIDRRQKDDKNDKVKQKQRYNKNGGPVIKSLQLQGTSTPSLNVTKMGKPEKPDQNTSQVSENNISILIEVVKPFTEHTNILQKLSQSRKQNIHLKNENRQNSTLISSMNIELSSAQNNMLIYKQKCLSITKTNEQLKQEIRKLTKDLGKANQDLNSMQKYYDQRWNAEFNKVKHQMQKKYEQLKKDLESQYSKLKYQLEDKKSKIFNDIQGYKSEAEKLKNANKILVQKIYDGQVAKQLVNMRIKQQERIKNQINFMHKQQILSLKYHYFNLNEDTLKVVKEKQAEIRKNQEELKGILEKNQQMEESIKEKYMNKIEIIKIQRDEENRINMFAKDQKINKLIAELQARNSTIQSLIKEQPQKRDMLTQKLEKQKQKEIKLVKVFHLEQVAKYVQKIGKLQEKIKELRAQSHKKQKEYHNDLVQKQRKIEEKNLKISLQEQAYGHTLDQLVNIQKQRQNFKNTIRNLQMSIHSLQVQSKSHNLIVKTKDEQIQRLNYNKTSWFNYLKESKVEFERGFKEIKEINQKKIAFLRSRIWELEHLNEQGITSKKDFEIIKNLSDDNKKLQEVVIKKQAQNLVLKQVNTYYQKKNQELDSKMTIQFELRQPRKLLLRKPKRDKKQLRVIKTQVSECCDFESSEGFDIKKINSKPEINNFAAMKNNRNHQGVHSASKSAYRSKTRINSSLM